MIASSLYGSSRGSGRIRYDAPDANLIENSTTPTSLTAIAGPAEPFIIPAGSLSVDGARAVLEINGQVGNTSGSAQSMTLSFYLGDGTVHVYSSGSGAFTVGNASASRALDITFILTRISATVGRIRVVYGIGNTGTVSSTDSGTAIGTLGSGTAARVAARNITIDPTAAITMKVVGTLSVADASVFCYVGERALSLA